VKALYEDILRRVNTPPKWWDDRGTPRFDLHTPSQCPDIYAKEVCLLRVACQCCRKEFDVQMHYDSVHLDEFIEACPTGTREERLEIAKSGPLAYFVRTKKIHYGDPPHHFPAISKRAQELLLEALALPIEDRTQLVVDLQDSLKDVSNAAPHQCTGNTMNVIDLRVLEFWRRVAAEWIRDPSLEIEIEAFDD
jgi:hypothetical protein